MKVKRFFAPTMAEALKLVSADMGPDAVILSNRKVDGGVEIVTALDYDENVARQRLGESAEEATNSARLAELQADQQRRLEEELNRSKARITEVRGHQSESVPASAESEPEGFVVRGRTDLDWNLPEPQPQTRQVQSPSQQVQHDELAAMKAEIQSLRDLVQAQGEQRASRSEPAPVQPQPQPAQHRLMERLQDFGLSHDLATALSRSHGRGRLEDGWKQALKTLAAGIKTSRAEWLEQGGIFALVGPTGAGKTTTIGKLAAQYVLRHGADSLALVTTDRFRVAAHEQLFVFGRILNVPVRVVDDRHSLDDILAELSDRHLVLIDTAGLNQGDKGYQQQLAELAGSDYPIRPHLVVSATSQPRIMKSVWHCYKMADLAGCVITKLDEALTLGESLGFAMETGLPVAYYTDGQKIPDDLHHAEPATLVRQGVERLKQVQRDAVVAEGA
ncbi:flagellar biosynthesis protein FlhF [Marinobacter xestospongiae]|uniref:flagellar biosynthesis protein FlhF n=1 Tax=Marinobacter xestospongiae TaxID=994319 RepID=UPI002005C61C|nr:flagellar biosynthesis protein FlhF [Marinobacter xestospongiae]MCK7566568.1 flagellar biosynthesis protein FlhF [Marinobacter xestospongiae]